jgi:hypothetical protein
MKGGGGEDSNSPSPDGVVLNFDSSMTRDAVFDHLVRHPEQNLGLLMLAGQPASRGIMRKAGSRDLLLCRDETVFMVSLLSSSATPSAAWSASWERQGLGDVAVGFRPGLASRFRLAGGSYTAVLEDLVAQLADWSATGEFGLASVDLRRNRCDLEMIPGSGATSSDLLAAVENLRHNWARRGEGASPPNGGDHLEFDPVQGNEWCRNLLENCRVEKLSNRLRIDAPLSALLGIGLRMGSGPDESKSFAQIWSDHESSRLTLALGLMRSALLAYRSEHGTFPPPALRRDANSPPYSWRVALLPYLGRQDLFDQYRLDLPWNSPENLQLLSQIPDVYRSFGSFSSSTPFRHGAALNASTAEHLLSDWTEAESIALFGATVVSIPWTSPLDEHWEEVPVSRGSGAVGGVLAVLQTGDFEQRVGSTLVDVQSSTDVSVP